MSNAMRSGKRLLAGVAAGALALGALTIASAPAASAKPNVKPKAAVTGTVTPVRVTFQGSTIDNVPYAQVSWATTAAIVATDTVVLTITQAPSTSARLALGPGGVASPGASGSIGLAVGFASSTFASTSPYNSAGYGLGAAQMPSTGVVVGPGNTFTAGQTARLAIAASQAGTYAGTIETFTGGAANDTVSFSFTTTGRPASMTVTPATQTVPAIATGRPARVAVSLADATGARTQPAFGDSVAMTVAPAVTNLGLSPTTLSDANFFDGTENVDFGTGTQGVYVITATPLGTLPTQVTAQTAIVNVTGSVVTTPVSTMSVAVPATAVNAGSTPNFTAQIPAGTSSVTVSVTSAAGTIPVGGVVRLRATTGAATTGTPNNSAYAYANVTFAASPTPLDSAQTAGTATFTIAGTALASTSTLTVIQVDGANAQAGTVNLVATQTTAAVGGAYVTPTPAGNVVAKVGDTTNASVLVTTQFLAPQAGWTVLAYRNSVATANLVASGVTGANGTASVALKPASTTVAGQAETYIYMASGPAGQLVQSSFTTIILYTADGLVTTLSATVGTAGATSPITNLTTSVPRIPFGTVPTDGYVDSATTGVYTVATATGTAAGDYITFTPTAVPGNAVTVTVPTGVKVTNLDPAVYTIPWDGGAQSVVVSNNAPVYVFATKVGSYDVTFTSGGKTVTAKARFANEATDYYNIALTPATQDIQTDNFGRVLVKVTDVFGNPVNSGASNIVKLTATGAVLMSGLSSSVSVATDSNGEAAVAVVGGTLAGEGKIVAGPGVLANAWAPGYVAPDNAPAPVTKAEVTVRVTSTSSKSITIVGARGTVSGKPGIVVDGTTTGLEAGKTVIPFVRFPGGEYTQGTARPKISASGDFEWSRKTGKKAYVYFTNDDGKVSSNRIIIQAS